MADFPLPDDTPASAGSVPEVPSGVEPSGKPVWADWPDERLLELRMCDSRSRHRAQSAGGPDCRAASGTRGEGHHLPAALLALGRVVHAGRRGGRSHPVLPGPPAPIPSRAGPDAGGGGWDAGMVHEDSASRGGPCHRPRVPARPAADASAPVRQAVHAISRAVHAQAIQQELRPAPRLLVRPEPPGRGLRRDLRRLADAQRHVAAAVRRMAGAAEARVHGRADEESRRQDAGASFAAARGPG